MIDSPPPAGARPRPDAYMLIERLGDGSHLRDIFLAPSHAEAIARAQDVIEGRQAELWRGAQLICSWKPPIDGAPAEARLGAQVLG